VRILVTDVGDVLVNTWPGRQYAALARLADLSIGQVTDRLDSADITTAFNCGLLDTNEFAESVCHLLDCQLEIASIKRAWCAVIGNVEADMVRAVLPLARQKRLWLASNTDAIHWPLVCRRLAAAGIRVPSILSFQVGLAKPSAEFFEIMTCEYIKAQGPVGYIDDQAVNVEAAMKWGFRAIAHTAVASSVQWIKDSFFNNFEMNGG
jgi:putative hydrolase of the HAD superfamily